MSRFSGATVGVRGSSWGRWTVPPAREGVRLPLFQSTPEYQLAVYHREGERRDAGDRGGGQQTLLLTGLSLGFSAFSSSSYSGGHTPFPRALRGGVYTRLTF